MKTRSILAIILALGVWNGSVLAANVESPGPSEQVLEESIWTPGPLFHCGGYTFYGRYTQ